MSSNISLKELQELQQAYKQVGEDYDSDLGVKVKTRKNAPKSGESIAKRGGKSPEDLEKQATKLLTKRDNKEKKSHRANLRSMGYKVEEQLLASGLFSAEEIENLCVDEGLLDKVKSAVGLKKKADSAIKDIRKKPSGTIDQSKVEKLRKDSSGHKWKSGDDTLKYVPKASDKKAKESPWKKERSSSNQGVMGIKLRGRKGLGSQQTSTSSGPGLKQSKEKASSDKELVKGNHPKSTASGSKTGAGEKRSNTETKFQRPAKNTRSDSGLAIDAAKRRELNDPKKNFKYSSTKGKGSEIQSDPGGNVDIKREADKIHSTHPDAKKGKTGAGKSSSGGTKGVKLDNTTKGGAVKSTQGKSSTGSSISAVDKLKAKKDRGYTKIGEERNETFHELIDVMIQQGFPIEEMVIEMYNNAIKE